jgi:hypothetical protein
MRINYRWLLDLFSPKRSKAGKGARIFFTNGIFHCGTLFRGIDACTVSHCQRTLQLLLQDSQTSSLHGNSVAIVANFAK